MKEEDEKEKEEEEEEEKEKDRKRKKKKNKNNNNNKKKPLGSSAKWYLFISSADALVWNTSVHNENHSVMMLVWV